MSTKQDIANEIILDLINVVGKSFYKKEFKDIANKDEKQYLISRLEEELYMLTEDEQEKVLRIIKTILDITVATDNDKNIALEVEYTKHRLKLHEAYIYVESLENELEKFTPEDAEYNAIVQEMSQSACVQYQKSSEELHKFLESYPEFRIRK